MRFKRSTALVTATLLAACAVFIGTTASSCGGPSSGGGTTTTQTTGNAPQPADTRCNQEKSRC